MCHSTPSVHVLPPHRNFQLLYIMPELTTQEIRSRNRQAYRQEQDLPKVKWAAFQGDDDLRKVLLLHILLVLSEAESSGLAGSDRLKVPLTKRRAGRFIPMGLDWNTSAPRFMPDETMQPEVIQMPH